MKRFILPGLIFYVLIASCGNSLLEKDVLEGYVLDSLIVSPITVQLKVGSTAQMEVKGKYIKIQTTIITNDGVLGSVADTMVEIQDTQIAEMDPTDVVWHSDDLFICTVSDLGILEAKHIGSTGVWCEKDEIKSNFVSVNVIP